MSIDTKPRGCGGCGEILAVDPRNAWVADYVDRIGWRFVLIRCDCGVISALEMLERLDEAERMGCLTVAIIGDPPPAVVRKAVRAGLIVAYTEGTIIGWRHIPGVTVAPSTPRKYAQASTQEADLLSELSEGLPPDLLAFTA